MQRLRSFYHKNKNTMWAIIIIAIIVIGVVQLLNRYTREETLKKLTEGNRTNSTGNSTIGIPVSEKDPVVSGGTISESEAIKNKNIINTFVEYCNDRDIQSAYDILTDECKEMFFPTIQDFFNNYYEKVFREYKICDIQVWVVGNIGYTYKVVLMEDILATGDIGQANTFTDYYTIIKTEEGEQKLNINRYIGRTEINKKGQSTNVTITVVSKDVFMDYEVYDFEVKNNTEKTILLDSKRSTDTVFLEDTKEVKYRSYMYEVDDVFLKLDGYMNRKVSIKFNKVYNPDRKIKYIIFTDIILDYQEYLEQIEDYENIDKIAVGI